MIRRDLAIPSTTDRSALEREVWGFAVDNRPGNRETLAFKLTLNEWRRETRASTRHKWVMVERIAWGRSYSPSLPKNEDRGGMSSGFVGWLDATRSFGDDLRGCSRQAEAPKLPADIRERAMAAVEIVIVSEGDA